MPTVQGEIRPAANVQLVMGDMVCPGFYNGF
jgi:hypothetical protein